MSDRLKCQSVILSTASTIPGMATKVPRDRETTVPVYNRYWLGVLAFRSGQMVSTAALLHRATKIYGSLSIEDLHLIHLDTTLLSQQHIPAAYTTNLQLRADTGVEPN